MKGSFQTLAMQRVQVNENPHSMMGQTKCCMMLCFVCELSGLSSYDNKTLHIKKLHNTVIVSHFL